MHSSERLKGIDVFVCVADTGSFTGAGERLHLTTSAVSKAIARLEKRLQVRLFDRTTRRLALTEAGREFYHTCTGVLAHLEEAELSLHANNNEFKGRLRIDLSASYGRLHVLPAILDFVKQHPQLEPHITLSDRFVDPVEEGIDIIVRIGGSGSWPAALDHYPIGVQRLIFCASPDYLHQRGEPVDEQTLAEHGCVLYGTAEGTASPLHGLEIGTGKVQRPAATRIAIGDIEGQATAVIAGHGIAQLPLWLVREHLKSGRLVQVLPGLEAEGLPMNIAWLRSREKLPKVKTLVEHLKSTLSPAGHNCGAE